MSILRAELPRTEAGVVSFIANKTKKFTGAALKRVCQRAYKSAIRESIKEEKKRVGQATMDFNEPATVLEIRREHFEKAITAVGYMESMRNALQ